MKYDVCIITEKSSQAKNYSTALGGPSGTLKSGPLAGKTYIITNAVGHLYNLADSSKQVSEDLQWKYGPHWQIEDGALPWDKDDIKWKLKKSEGKSKVIEDIVKYAKNSDDIIVACDSDDSFEGDMIACEILIENDLNKKKHFWRSLHKDESVKEINKAIEKLVDYGTDLEIRPEYIASNFRRKYDYLLGLQETRLATKISGDNLLRWGRLKSYILKICYDQQQLIDNYVEIPFFEAKFKDENEVLYSDPKSEKYENESDVPIGDFHSSKVIKDSTEKKTQIPPKFKNLAQIAAALSSKYSGKQVESTYQKMYEDSILSYPRTESQFVTEEGWKAYASIADKVAEIIGVDPKLLTHKAPRETHIKDGISHDANHPISADYSLAELQEKYGTCGRDIYEYVARNTLTAFCSDYEYDLEKGHLEDYPTFKGSKQKPTKLGWKEIFTDDEDLDSAVGLGTSAEPFVFRGTNPKPEALTFKWIIKQLVKNDVGTGSTQLATTNQLCDDSDLYHPLDNNRGKISLTNYGIISGRLLNETKVADMNFTKDFYAKRKEVFKDSSKAEVFLDEISQIILFDIAKVKDNLSKFNITELTGSSKGEPLGDCPCCKKEGRSGKIYSVRTKYGKQIYVCSENTEENRVCKFYLDSKYKYFKDIFNLSPANIKNLLEGKTVSQKITAQSGKKYAWDVKLVVNDAGYVQFEKVDFTKKK